MGASGRRRWRIALALAIAVGICAALLWRTRGEAERAVKQTRLALRKQGFKTDLADFDFSTSAEARRFETGLIALEPGHVSPRSEPPELMTAAGPDSAIVVWRQDWLGTRSGGLSWPRSVDSWPALAEALDAQREELDQLCDAALAGPIRFNLDANQGMAMLLRHLPGLKNLAQTLGSRTVLELHNGNRDAAWTNLLASTRLVTAWNPEPVEVSHLVRFALEALVYNTTWQALQADGWSDERLARLQQEWESVDFLRNLPETAAFAGACAVAMCERTRHDPAGPGVPVSELVKAMLRSPRYATADLKSYWSQVRYRSQGSFEDEKALLLFYRDRELELRRAVEPTTWLQMRPLPGVTNRVSFNSKHPSRVQAILNMKALSLSFQGQGKSFLGRAAEAEAQRRLISTALALKRYRMRQDAYPASLHALAPEFLKQPPTDFIDGHPLRYRLTDDDHFVLYSLGLDGVDRGGTLRQPRRTGIPYEDDRAFGAARSAGLVWPRPASAAQAELVHQEEVKAREERLGSIEEMQDAAWWDRTTRRQRNVEKILVAPPAPTTNDPAYHGRRLSEVLQNASGTNKFTLAQLLTLKQVPTPAKPEIVTFEFPINYDALTTLGCLDLYIDPNADEDSDEGWHVGECECTRATNGNCRLVWNTIYETPGQHALLAGLDLNETANPDEGFLGPLAPFVVSNLCQFSLSSAHFEPETGATLNARLPESNGTYTIEFNSPSGERLKTIPGITSNGMIKVHWDLIDDRGQRFQSESFDTVFHIALPASGRSQTLKGP